MEAREAFPMIKIRLSGRPTARFYEMLDHAVAGEFEYFVDSHCMLHLWSPDVMETMRSDLLEDFLATAEERYADDRVLCDMRRAVEALQAGVCPYQAFGLAPPEFVPTPPAKAKEHAFRTAVKVHRTLRRKRNLSVAVEWAIRDRGPRHDPRESVVHWYRSYKRTIDVLRSDSLLQARPGGVAP